MRKHSSEENSKGVVDSSFDKDISVGVNQRPNQPSHQKPGIQMGLYQQKLPAGINGNKENWMD